MTARLAVLVCLTGLLCACPAVGPDYKRPQLETPARFSEDRAAQAQAGGAGSAPAVQSAIQPTPDVPISGVPDPAAQSGGAAPERAVQAPGWWRDFGDETLDALMEEAATANLDLAQAKARIVQARASLRQATGSLGPTVSGSASLSRTYNTVNAQAPSTTGSTESWTDVYQAGFDATWELDLFGGLRRSRQASQATYEASRESARDALVTVQGDVATAYVTLRSAQARLELARRNTADLADLADITRVRLRAGLVSGLDQAQAQAKLAAAQAEMPGLETEARQAAHRLGVLTGQGPAALKARLLKPAPLSEPLAARAPGLPSDLLERRPDLRQAERALASASASIGVSVAKLYPTVDLTGGLGLQNGDFAKFVSFTPWFASLAPQITLPVFTSGKTRAEIAGKQAAYEESLAKYRAAWLTALEDVENALAAYYGELENRRRLERTVAAYEENLAVAQERYLRGLTTFLDVLDAKTSLHAASVNLVKSRAALLTDLAGLAKALGGGWAAPGQDPAADAAKTGDAAKTAGEAKVGDAAGADKRNPTDG